MKEHEWTYVDKYRRYKNNPHHTSQLYIDGKWVDINTDMFPNKK